jgi:surface antigen
MTRRYSHLMLATLLLSALVVAPAARAAIGFGEVLKGTNFAAFTDADMKLFLNTAETTVRSQPDGVDVRWNSDKSGANGTMHVVRTYERDGHTCRQLGGETVVKANTEPFSLTYCKDPAGRWRLASPTSP